MNARRLAVALSMALSLAGCGEGKPRTPAADGPASEQAAGGAATSAPGAGCVKEGDWTPCAVKDRLERAGLVFEVRDSAVTHPFFRVPGIAYRVGGREDEVQLFLYPSTAERTRDTEALDSATVSPRGERVTWPAPPTLITSNNLAAVILSLNERTIERLALALGAGLPQPGRE